MSNAERLRRLQLIRALLREASIEAVLLREEMGQGGGKSLWVSDVIDPMVRVETFLVKVEDRASKLSR